MYLPPARSASNFSRADWSSATLAGVPIRQPLVGQAPAEPAVAVGPSAPRTTNENRTTHTITIVRDAMSLITFLLLSSPTRTYTSTICFCCCHTVQQPWITCQPANQSQKHS